MNYELYHHGVVGMHWGVRRYQNADGSLKPAGRKRYTEGGTNSAKSSNGGKKQLTDEERAARNAKIKSTAKKVAIGVGVTALVAAGTYAAVKYNNKTMAEAKQIMSSSRKEKLDRYLDELTEINDQEVFSRKMYDRAATASYKNQWSFANQEAKGRLADKLTERAAYKSASERHMADKAIQRQAQKEIINRDLGNVRAQLYSKYREARGDLPQNVGLNVKRNRERANRNIANLLNETPYEKRLREMAEKEAERLRNRR